MRNFNATKQNGSKILWWYKKETHTHKGLHSQVDMEKKGRTEKRWVLQQWLFMRILLNGPSDSWDSAVDGSKGDYSLFNMVVVTHRPTFSSSKLTEGLEYNALKHDQVLGLLQVSLRSRGQAGYSQGLMHSYHSLSHKYLVSSQSKLHNNYYQLCQYRHTVVFERL